MSDDSGLNQSEIHEQDPWQAMSVGWRLKKCFVSKIELEVLTADIPGPAHQSSSVFGSFQVTFQLSSPHL